MMVNISFGSSTIDILKGIIGKYLEYYSCDLFVFTHSVFAVIGLKIKDDYYKITADLEPIQRFYEEDLWQNCGRRPDELRCGTASGMPDTLLIGPNLKKLFEEGKMDRKEFEQELRKLGIELSK